MIEAEYSFGFGDHGDTAKAKEQCQYRSTRELLSQKYPGKKCQKERGGFVEGHCCAQWEVCHIVKIGQQRDEADQSTEKEQQWSASFGLHGAPPEAGTDDGYTKDITKEGDLQRRELRGERLDQPTHRSKGQGRHQHIEDTGIDVEYLLLHICS